jgi:hypothetical protein
MNSQPMRRRSIAKKLQRRQRKLK